MKLLLRNGIVVETCANKGYVRAIHIPSHYKGNWYEGVWSCLYFGHTDNPLGWTGGAHGDGYDVIMEVKEIEYEM